MSTDELPHDVHRRAQALLPWLVNGTLRGPERGWLDAHLETCVDCRRALELERRIAACIATEPVVEYAPQVSLAQLWRRIDALPSSGSRRAALRRSARRLRRPPALTQVLVAQAVAILVLALGLGWLALRPDSGAPYRTLSRDPAFAAPHLQVVFEDAVTAAAITGALQTVNGHIVDGPSSAGVFRVVIGAARDRAALDAAAQRLAAQPGVRFVSAQWPVGDTP